MKKELEAYVDFAKKKKLKLTRQREGILDEFLSAGRHVSAEDLYGIVKKKHPSVGRATVFRTLKLLCEADIAREVFLGDKIKRFEPYYKQKHHDHLVCVRCGRVIEAVEPEIERLQDVLCKKVGFSPQSHKLEIFGFCKKCRKK